MAKSGKIVPLEEVRDSLAERQRKIHSKTISLRDVKVLDHNTIEVEGMKFEAPVLGDRGVDPHVIRQLCKTIGMSSGFYNANPSVLNTEIFRERFASIEEDEANRQIRWREQDGKNILLAILPVEHQAPNYVDIVEPFLETVPGNSIVRLTNHEHVDTDHRLTMRISLSDYAMTVKGRDHEPEHCELGFFLDMSEDGNGPKMTATSMLYNQWCTNGAMTTYDSHPYFEYNYRGIRAADLKAALNSMVNRFAGDVETINDRVIAAEKDVMSKSQALGFLKGLESRREISLGFIRKVRHDLESKNVEQISRWRVINNITFAAQSLPYDGRVQHEFVAGSLLGLNLKQAA